MKARDVMVSPVITVKPDSLVKDVAKIFLERRISGAPVIDDQGKLAGIVSEGDLVYRSEIGTQRSHPYWFLEMAKPETLAAEYVKAHARTVADIMTRDVITATPITSLNEIAGLFERHAIKRVPIIENGQLVGIVSRANLIQAVASSSPKEFGIPLADSTIRSKLLSHLNEQRWAKTSRLNVIVSDGVVNLWGITSSDVEKQAIRVAAESIPDVCAVNDHLVVQPVEVPVKERDIATR